MWCTNCQQDVPAIAHGDMARCAQCGRFLKRRPEAPALPLPPGEGWGENALLELPLAIAETTPLLPTAPIANAIELEDDWTLQQRVRHLQRRLRFDNAALTLPAFHSELLSPSTIPSLDASQSLEAAKHVTPNNRSAHKSGHVGAFIAWFAITVGTLSFLCGAGLLIWWFIDGSRELWSLGLPLASACQFGLLFGLVLQLNRLSRTNRRIAESLDRTDREFQQMNHSLVQLPNAHGVLSEFIHASRWGATP
jgi:hypothetical protein